MKRYYAESCELNSKVLGQVLFLFVYLRSIGFVAAAAAAAVAAKSN